MPGMSLSPTMNSPFGLAFPEEFAGQFRLAHKGAGAAVGIDCVRLYHRGGEGDREGLAGFDVAFVGIDHDAAGVVLSLEISASRVRDGGKKGGAHTGKRQGLENGNFHFLFTNGIEGAGAFFESWRSSSASFLWPELR